MNVGWNLYEKSSAYELLTFHVLTPMKNVWNFYEMSMKNLYVSWTKKTSSEWDNDEVLRKCFFIAWERGV